MDSNVQIIEGLLQKSENEVLELKEAKESFDIDDLGRYFSALSNEANLREMDFAWMVFGVADKTHEIVGTRFKESEKSLNKLKNDMAQHTTGNIIFREIVPVQYQGKRLLLFKIPASPRNIVTCWKGVAWARRGDSLVPLDQAKQDEIRHQPPLPDWSAQVVREATIADLDRMALFKAREEYKKVHDRIPTSEIEAWSDEEFLNRSGIMIEQGLTRAALLLLGKPESVFKLRPAVAEITWTLRDERENVVDYKHFTIPFILTVDEVLAKIRNLTMRELPGGTLFPDTMPQYDDYTIRESLHNCIAHQDYTLRQRVNFVERPGSLYYENGGTFIPETIENALAALGPQRYYRNNCLCTGMVNFNMIDTVGRGIKTIYEEQIRRHFPMPDYHIDNEKREVAVTIYGKMLDEKYTKLLQEDTSLSLRECIWLDAIQKHRPITPDAIKVLRDKKLIEGRSPNLRISLKVAKKTHQLSDYSKIKGLEKDRIVQMISSFLVAAGDDGAKREEIFDYVKSVMPSDKNDGQNRRALGNILVEMKGQGKILVIGKRWYSIK